MAKYTGKDGIVKTDTAQVSNVTGFSIEETSEELDASVIDGTNDYDCMGGQEKRSGTVEILYDPVDPGQINMEIGATVALELYPTGEAILDMKWSGNALITSLSTPVEVNGMLSQSVGFTVQGAWTKEVITA